MRPSVFADLIDIDGCFFCFGNQAAGEMIQHHAMASVRLLKKGPRSSPAMNALLQRATNHTLP